jgi:hypothetical protein
VRKYLTRQPKVRNYFSSVLEFSVHPGGEGLVDKSSSHYVGEEAERKKAFAGLFFPLFVNYSP